jgi:lactate dehydrogenase-like 2-hydroxyacid dehydrogenase
LVHLGDFRVASVRRRALEAAISPAATGGISTSKTQQGGAMAGPARILQVGDLPPAAVALLEQHFTLRTVATLGAQEAPAIVGIATGGKAPIDAALLARLPNLRLVSCLGAGTDGIDTDWLAARGIAIATTSAVLAADVADVALGAVIALARDFRRADRFVRDGRWRDGKYPLGVALRGARLGVLGLGAIGSAVATRAGAFGMDIGYHTRTPRPAVPHRHFASLRDLATWCRFLVVACPGGPLTRHLVDARVLAALGPDGFLVNVARGSVVDEAALGAALSTGTIAGAGLDVFENEPTPDPTLLAQDNTLVLPHIGSATTQTRDAMARAMVDALRALG